jgi:putative membrane protein
MAMKTWMTAALVGALTLAPAVAMSQNALPAEDRKFVTEALKHGQAEVELGKLAAEKASNDGVKKFGQRMVDDHGKAGDELKKIAQDKGLTPPTEPDGKHKKLHERLSKMSGADFDRVYMDEMVKDHRKDVKEFQQRATKAKDADVKGFAGKTLPTLQEHLKEAESLHAQVKNTGKAAKADNTRGDSAAKTEKK